ncbi:Uncharacterised protein [Candidatus Tiddalikarchaeum anstoanum]|nr:Uncharacterised protein [Candidatus Tiddalikarchaeum anstoanum]
MVVESFISADDARKNPWYLFFLGMVYASMGILLAMIIFPNQASLTAVFLTTLATAPLFVSLLKSEEVIQIELIEQRKPLLLKQIDIISVFFFLFLGFTLAFSFWFTFLPDTMVESVFNTQVAELTNIQGLTTGNLFNEGIFTLILQNNLRVLLFIIIISFIYGAGSILILAWNASVLGSAVGLFIKEQVGSLMGTDYLNNLALYFSSLPAGLGQYMVHGSFEMGAYFIGSFVGGIISAAVVRKQFININFLKFLKNVTVLITIALLLLVIAAYIEVSL